MSTPAAQIVVSGTPITNQLGVGAVAGNAVTISGLTLAPNQPGWMLASSQGSPGFVSGTWQYGAPIRITERPQQGASYRSDRGGIGGGGAGDSELLPDGSVAGAGFQLGKGGWLLLGLIATLILTDKGK